MSILHPLPGSATCIGFLLLVSPRNWYPRPQLQPTSILLQIAYEQVVHYAWAFFLGARLELAKLGALDAANPANAAGVDEQGPGRPYLSSRSDLRRAQSYLIQFLQDFQTNGTRCLERHKDQLAAIFGTQFYDSLTQWSPMALEAIRMAIFCQQHSEMYNLPNPPEIMSPPVVADPNQQYEIVLKLVEQKYQQLDDLRQCLAMGKDAAQSGFDLDIMCRYSSPAARELRRAVEFYFKLKMAGL